MAIENLVPFNTGEDDSGTQSVGAGEVHTLYPLFEGQHGVVVIYSPLSNGGRQHIARLSTTPPNNKTWQIVGPTEYIVSVKNAGCDRDTGV